MHLPILVSQRTWLAAFIFWVAALFTLSSFSAPMPPSGPKIPHLDKVIHFTYFAGGAFVFTTWLRFRKNGRFRIFFALLIFAIIGALDEWHQTFTPGRTGNDPFDWLADILGSLTGIFIANSLHPLLLKFSSPAREKPHN